MKRIVIPITALPRLTDGIKHVIGLTLWHLYKISSEDSNVEYLLKTDDLSYLLDSDGNILMTSEPENSYDMISEVFFEGYVIPSDIHINSILNTICR